MALMEVRLVQRYLGQICIMGFNYLSSGTPAAVTLSFALTEAMGFAPSSTTLAAGTVGGLLQAAQNTSTEFISTSVRDVYSNVDFYESPFLPGTNGTNAGIGSMNTFNAAAFVSTKTRTDIRRGQRRMVGISEANVASGGQFESAYLTGALTNLADAFSEVLEYVDEGNPISFQPVIVAKERYAVPGSSPVRYAYRYYEDEAVQLQNIMTSIVWTAQDFTTTQNSRKRGRGA